MIRHARETPASTVIVGTELGLVPRLQRESPGKQFVPASPYLVCPDMKMITLELVEDAIAARAPVVTVPREVAARARVALERMLALPAS